MTFSDSLRETFDDCCLSDSWLTDETWIVFCLSIKDGYESFDFFVSSDDDINFPGLCFGSEIYPEEVESWSLTFFFFSSGDFFIDGKW